MFVLMKCSSDEFYQAIRTGLLAQKLKTTAAATCWAPLDVICTPWIHPLKNSRSGLVDVSILGCALHILKDHPSVCAFPGAPRPLYYGFQKDNSELLHLGRGAATRSASIYYLLYSNSEQ